MFKKNKKKLDTQITREFKIPQFDNSTMGLKMGKRKFLQSQVASPVFGTQVKDEIYAYDQQGTSDVRIKYENFRPTGEKKVSEEELMALYGSKYYEFNPLTNNDKREFYGSDIPARKPNPAKKQVSQKNQMFSFIADKNTFLAKSSNEKREEQYQNNSFGKQETTSFKSVTMNNNFDNLDEFEVNSFSGNTSTNLPSFLQSSSLNQSKPSLVNKPRDFSTSANSNIIEKDFDLINNQRSNDRDSENATNNSSFKFIDSFNQQSNRPDFTNNTQLNNVQAKNLTNNIQFVNQSINAVHNQMQIPKNTATALLASDNNLYYNYVLPSTDMFKKSASQATVNHAWAEEKKELIDACFKAFQIGGQVVNYTVGPTLSRFEIALNSDQNVKKISSLRDTIQLHLAVKTLRILAPIPGKSTVGLEIPNNQSDTVYFGDIVNHSFYQNESLLNVALGKDIDDVGIYTQIDTMPHGLIAGSTGSGKSVCINTVLVSLLLRNTPDDLKLILIDPKQVELIYYDELPHLITPVIDDVYMASEALKWATEEMERRYQVLKNNRVRNIKEYNKKSLEDTSIKKMPYIVVVIDELADLMMKCANEVEDSIQLLAQKSRAAGIHLLVATQRPTVDVIKGNIKANIPTRVAFKVVTGTDSQTILDENGAEQLLGKGDMLIKQNDIPHRLQGAYISDEEILNVTDFIKNQVAPNYLFTHEHLKQQVQNASLANPAGHAESPQTLYNVAKFFFEEKNCSINKIQNYFNFGFNRAQRIFKTLEEMQIISKKPGNQFYEPIIALNELEHHFNLV